MNKIYVAVITGDEVTPGRIEEAIWTEFGTDYAITVSEVTAPSKAKGA